MQQKHYVSYRSVVKLSSCKYSDTHGRIHILARPVHTKPFHVIYPLSVVHYLSLSLSTLHDSLSLPLPLTPSPPQHH